MMKIYMKYVFLVALFALTPSLTFAQETGYSVQALIINLVIFLNDVIMPFILAMAFFIFVVNAIRYFVIKSNEEEGRKTAKNLAIYSLGAFVFILSFWGILNIVVSGVGFNVDPCDNEKIPDYIRGSAPCSSPRPPMRPEQPTGNPLPALDPFFFGPQ